MTNNQSFAIRIKTLIQIYEDPNVVAILNSSLDTHLEHEQFLERLLAETKYIISEIVPLLPDNMRNSYKRILEALLSQHE